MVSLEAGIQLYDSDITFFSSDTQTASITNGGAIHCLTLSGDGTAVSHIQYQNVDGLSTVGHTGAYGDLSGTPTDLSQFTNNAFPFNGLYRYAHMGDLNNISLTPGPEGPMGSKGDKGDKGDTGDTGATGAAGTTDYNSLTNRPGLCNVALSGSYLDLSGCPTIPAAQVQTDWNVTSGLGVVLNKPTLSTVAVSGSYVDLLNPPTIPAAQVQSDWNATSGIGVILNKPTLAAIVGSGSFAEVAYSGLATDLTFPPEASAPFILYSTIKWLLPSTDALQSNWITNGDTSPSYIRNKPPITYISDTIITGNVACSSNIECSSNVTAAQFFGRGDLLTDLSLMWTTNGTIVYIPAGSNVGNIASPTVALDIGGSVNVSGGLIAQNLNTGNVATKTYFKVGTLPAAGLTAQYGWPAGCVASNIISISGVMLGFAISQNLPVPRGHLNPNYVWDTWVNGGGLFAWVPTGSLAFKRPFRIIITTT